MLITIPVLCILPTIVCASQILGAFTVPSVSHQKPLLNLAKELSLRGHQVTAITTNPLKDKSLANLTEIDISFLYEPLRRIGGFEQIFSSDFTLWQQSNKIRDYFDFAAEEILKSKDVQNVLNSGKSFDVVIVEPHDPIFFALGPKFHAPVIAVSSLGVFLNIHDAIGNPSHPVLAPDLIMPYTGTADAPILQRLNALLYHIWYRALHYYNFVPRMDKIIQKYFGNEFPSVQDNLKQVSMVLATMNPIMDTVRPNVPTVINIEMLHKENPKPLPKDIKGYLDASSSGFVYFSLGSNIKSSQLNNDMLTKITKALGNVPYNVLWKFEKDDFPAKPKNVMIRKWLPQQNLLGHPNIKVFVTQGGLQSIEEAIFKGIPMVGLPFMADQQKNTKKLDKWNIGISLNPFEMTSEELRQAITEVATNSSFKKNLLKVKSIIEDQPLTGVDKAIWYIEYVLRHNGTAHLHYPGADMPLYKYLLLDVIAVIFFFMLLLVFIVVKIMSKIKNILFSKKVKTQ